MPGLKTQEPTSPFSSSKTAKSCHPFDISNGFTINPEILKSVIFDQHEIIRNAHIVPRRYSLDPQANYVITGLRRAGKSTLLYKIARDLVESGVEWNRIIYINFEDERLAEFRIGDFNDILSAQSELSRQSGFFFFDEILNVDGWENLRGAWPTLANAYG